MALNALKLFLPARPVLTRVWLGPFRGARIVMSPRASVRKALGLYEHELNPWLGWALHRVRRVLDVGANDGYFTLGCAAALRRLGTRNCQIFAFEPQARHVLALRQSVAALRRTDIQVEIIQAFVGREIRDGMTTLDSLPLTERKHTLVKIDVEGAELDVIEGARTWMDRSNLFLIEVHEQRFLSQLRNLFAEHGHRLAQLDQRPLCLVGRERREANNWWLVTNGARGRGRQARHGSTGTG